MTQPNWLESLFNAAPVDEPPPSTPDPQAFRGRDTYHRGITALEQRQAGARWFVRCTVCLTVACVTENPAKNWECGICKGQIENMGRVERDRLVKDSLLCPCDDRCTSARGPNCTCRCNGKNHGSNLLVLVTRDAGKAPAVPAKTHRAQVEAETRAREYRAGVAALRALIDRFGEGYLPRADWEKKREIQAALRKVDSARDHKARVRTFTTYAPTWYSRKDSA